MNTPDPTPQPPNPYPPPQNITAENMESYIGYDIPAKFLEVDEESERLVFSHRRASSSADMQGYKVRARTGKATASLPLQLLNLSLPSTSSPQHAHPLTPSHPLTFAPKTPPPPNPPKQVGDVVVGVVQSVRPYGAFVDIGGAIGLLHISQITHERLTTVDQVLAEGDKLKVMILSQDADRGRVTLSTKKLEPEPGDMLRDPQKVFENADKMAEMFRQRVAAADSQNLASLDGDYPPMDPAYPPPGSGYAAAPMAGQEQAAAFDS